jgi:hypothetical protein
LWRSIYFPYSRTGHKSQPVRLSHTRRDRRDMEIES